MANRFIILMVFFMVLPAVIQASDCDEFRGKAQSLTMGRDRGGVGMAKGAYAGSMAFTFAYKKCLPFNIATNVQVVHATTYYNSGAFSGGKRAAYNLSNGSFSNLNELNIAYTFKQWGFDNTELKIGRQILNLNFATAYNIRQKAQSFEAIVLHSSDIPSFDISIGHLEKFSSWTSKRDLTTGSSANRFMDIEKVEAFPLKTNGFQFGEITYHEGSLVFSVYDYYGQDLYNTLGIKTTYQWQLSTDKNLSFKLHYLNQQDVGRYYTVMAKRVKANAFQVGILLDYQGLNIEPGVFLVGGDKADNNLHTPFQPNLIIEEAMIETDLGFAAGSRSYYLESSYKKDIHTFYFLYLHTKAGHKTLAQVTSKEANFIYKYDWGKKKGWYAALKLAYLTLDYKAGTNAWSTDSRLFAGYKW